MSPDEFRFKDLRKTPMKESVFDPLHPTGNGIQPSVADRLEALGYSNARTAEKEILFLALLTSAEENKKLPPEKTHFQVLLRKSDDEFARSGLPTKDRDSAEALAIDSLQNPNIKEAFVVTVHSAYSKEVNIKKVI